VTGEPLAMDTDLNADGEIDWPTSPKPRPGSTCRGVLALGEVPAPAHRWN
jgi:hypothetical protein